MTEREEAIIKRNELWIKEELDEINLYKTHIAKNEQYIEEMRKQNRELKGGTNEN